MDATELLNAVTAAGWEGRLRGAEVSLHVCYFCGNSKYNLELSADKGVYHCWACRRGGRLDEFLKHLTGREYHIPLAARDSTTAAPVAAVKEFRTSTIWQTPSAVAYLTRRGLPPTVAAQYGVEVCVEPGHLLYARLVIPMREYWTNAVVGWMGRTYTQQVPKYLSTLPRKVLTGWRRRDARTPVVITEGPFDGIAAHRAGFGVLVLSGTGGGGVEAWAARLPAETPVVVLLDADAAGPAQRLLWTIRAVRGTDRTTHWVPLPVGEDPDSLGPEEVRRRIQAALSGIGPTVNIAGHDLLPGGAQ